MGTLTLRHTLLGVALLVHGACGGPVPVEVGYDTRLDDLRRSTPGLEDHAITPERLYSMEDDLALTLRLPNGCSVSMPVEQLRIHLFRGLAFTVEARWVRGGPARRSVFGLYTLAVLRLAECGYRMPPGAPLTPDELAALTEIQHVFTLAPSGRPTAVQVVVAAGHDDDGAESSDVTIVVIGPP